MGRRRLLIGLVGLGLPGCNLLFGTDVHLFADAGPCGATAVLAACGADSIPVAGDWDGDGKDSPGLFDKGRWCITNRQAAGPVCEERRWGAAGDTPLVGDFDGDGIDSPGWFRDTRWNLDDANAQGDPADFGWGTTSMRPFAGNWGNRSFDTPGGVIAGSQWNWYLSDHNSGGGVDHNFMFGAGGIALVGDWNGDGIDTPAVFVAGSWTFSNQVGGGGPILHIDWGADGDAPLAGDCGRRRIRHHRPLPGGQLVAHRRARGRARRHQRADDVPHVPLGRPLATFSRAGPGGSGAAAWVAGAAVPPRPAPGGCAAPGRPRRR